MVEHLDGNKNNNREVVNSKLNQHYRLCILSRAYFIFSSSSSSSFHYTMCVGIHFTISANNKSSSGERFAFQPPTPTPSHDTLRACARYARPLARTSLFLLTLPQYNKWNNDARSLICLFTFAITATALFWFEDPPSEKNTRHSICVRTPQRTHETKIRTRAQPTRAQSPPLRYKTYHRPPTHYHPIYVVVIAFRTHGNLKRIRARGRVCECGAGVDSTQKCGLYICI